MEVPTTISYLRANPEVISILKAALEHYKHWEDLSPKKSWEETYIGFQGYMLKINAAPQEFSRLVKAGFLQILSKAKSGTWYKLTDVLTTSLALAKLELGLEKPESPQTLSTNLFASIVGYEEAKELFVRALESISPVHLLVIGPPASAKTLFLMEIQQLPRAEYHLGSSSSRAGLASRLIEFKPSYLLIDEIDKMPTDEQNVLLSLCETGLVKETKYGKWKEAQLDTKVFAAANRINSIRPEILSRFQLLYFESYRASEFEEIVVSTLGRKENVPVEVAHELALWLWDHSENPDIRESIRIARLMQSKTMSELKKVLALLTPFRAPAIKKLL